MSAENDVKPKVEAAAATEQLSIKVKAQDGSEVMFKVKKSTELKKVYTHIVLDASAAHGGLL